MFDNWRNDQWREIFSSDEADLTQAYFVYVKENRQSMAEKDPPVGALTIFKQALVNALEKPQAVFQRAYARRRVKRACADYEIKIRAANAARPGAFAPGT